MISEKEILTNFLSEGILIDKKLLYFLIYNQRFIYYLTILSMLRNREKKIFIYEELIKWLTIIHPIFLLDFLAVF